MRVLLRVPILALFSLLPATCPAATRDHVAVFGGVQVANAWQDVFEERWDSLDWRESGIVGVAYGRDWSPARWFALGFELQAALHVGEQRHAEVNLPIFARLTPHRLPPLRSLGFGIGPSFASRVPPIEVETRGGSAKTLLYWAIEAEFGRHDRPGSAFIRLHHRSNGFGAVAEAGGSNIIVLGFRHRW
jgi:hypothetical protein